MKIISKMNAIIYIRMLIGHFMKKIKISVVSYSNTIPFIYGLMHSPIISSIDLSLDIPAVCADKLITGESDVGLIPVIELKKIPQAEIVSDYCIGAYGRVRTVSLISEVPLPQIERVYLDFQSRTSVQLAQVLAKNFWKISPEYKTSFPGFENEVIHGRNAAVVIGDRNFGLEGKHAYHIDLAEEWKLFTGLPFVFALWASRISLPVEFKQQFNKALALGLDNIDRAVQMQSKNALTQNTNLELYLRENIDYLFESEKKQALQLFFEYVSRLAMHANYK